MNIKDIKVGMNVKLRDNLTLSERNMRSGPGFNVYMEKYLGTVVTVEKVNGTRIVVDTWEWHIDWIESIINVIPFPPSIDINIHNIHYME